MALTKVTGQVIKNTTDVTVGVLTVTNTLAVGGTVSIGGTLTYEDVTNVDAVGIITARSNILVGSGITLSPDGDIFATGISTFSEGFAGDVLIDDKIVHRGDTNTAIRFPSADTITAETGGSERLRVTSTGAICVSHTNALHSGNLQVSTSASDAIDVNAYSSTAANGGRLTFYRSKNASIGSNTIVADNDSLGRIDFRGYNSNGNAYNIGATIEAEVDGAVDSSTDMPSALTFGTSADGSSSPTERFRIASDGLITGRGELRLTEGTSVVNNGDEIGSLMYIYPSNSNKNAKIAALQTTGTSGADLAFYTRTQGDGTNTDGGTEKVRITSAGFVGIGSDVPQDKLTIMSANDNALLVKSTSTTQYHSARIHLQGGGTATDNVTALVHGNNNTGGSESYFAIESKNSGETYIKTLMLYHHASDYWDLNSGTAGNNTMRLNTGNQVIIGGSGVDRTFNSHAGRLQISGNNYSQATFSITNNANSNTGAYIFLCKQRSGAHGGSTAPVNGDIIGQLRFNSGDGTDMESVAGQIEMRADDNHASNSVPSRMSFYVTSAGGSSPTERIRIVAGGETIFGSVNPGVSEAFVVETGGTIRRRYSTTSGFGLHFTNDSIMPTRYDGVFYNGTGNLGASSYRWNTIFATNGTINTSDRNVKNTIQNSDLGLDFISKLTPVSYKMNAGTSGRTHYGLISQDVETVLTDIGKTGTDFAGFCKDINYKLESDGEGNDIKTELSGYNYSLRYEEFIAPLVKAVQELSAENTALKARLDAAGL